MNPNTAIRITNLSKQYRLGLVGTGTLSHDLKRWWTMNIQGKEDPYLKIGETNILSSKSHFLIPRRKGETQSNSHSLAEKARHGPVPNLSPKRRDTAQSPVPTSQSPVPNSQYVWALKDINLEIEQGDVVGIIGKNGAGKSTLLKILSRVTKPTTGTIEYRGRLASLLEVGTGFHPEMTGRENIYMNGAIMGMTRYEITRKLDEIIAFAGVERYIDTPVKRYSSGMTVRLGFSVAAHLEPDILVVDEVLAVGDAEFQKKAIGKMQDVSQKGGRTVLFVSHNMIAVKTLCNMGILLENGLIRNTGKIDSVVDNYLTLNAFSSFVEIKKMKEGIFLQHIKISDNGTPGNFNIEDNLKISVMLSCVEEIGKVNVNLFFNAPEGGLIFVTLSSAEKLEKGDYLFECFIPSNLLNDIAYSLDIMVVRNENYAIHYLKSVLTIHGIENRRSINWLGKFPGLIRPQDFIWNKIKMT